MKKKVFILLALMSSISAYAYDYGESSGSGFMTFVGILLLAWGILEIILFFKIWRMTGDVEALKRSLVDGKLSSDVSAMTLVQLQKSVRKKYYLGRIDEAENEISMFAYKKLMRLEGRVLQYDDKGGRFVSIPFGDAGLKQCDPDTFIQAVINEARPLYQAIGRKVPKPLDNLTYDEFISFARKTSKENCDTESEGYNEKVEIVCQHCNTRLLVHNIANESQKTISCPKCQQSIEVKF